MVVAYSRSKKGKRRCQASGAILLISLSVPEEHLVPTTEYYLVQPGLKASRVSPACAAHAREPSGRNAWMGVTTITEH